MLAETLVPNSETRAGLNVPEQGTPSTTSRTIPEALHKIRIMRKESDFGVGGCRGHHDYEAELKPLLGQALIICYLSFLEITLSLVQLLVANSEMFSFSHHVDNICIVYYFK